MKTLLALLATGIVVAQEDTPVIPTPPASIVIRVVVDGQAVVWDMGPTGREALSRMIAIKRVQGATTQAKIMEWVKSGVRDVAKQPNYAPAAARAKFAEAEAANRDAVAAASVE